MLQRSLCAGETLSDGENTVDDDGVDSLFDLTL